MSEFTRDWDAIDSLLDELMDLDDDAREQRMAQLTRERPELADRLRRMLDSVDKGAAFESLAASPLYSEALLRMSDLGPGDRLGDWTLLRPIGRGGMAEIFEAEREVAGSRQRAAIKLMAQSGFDPLRQQRFQRETSILARLEDPRLARLFDAGITADGRHWLAMEYIDGEPIDRACDRLHLAVAERVRLVIEVALAVDYAHRQLIVHRDLKPDNVLLSSDGRVHVVDFGIARILQGDGDPAVADATATQLRAYTLRFASPEQLSGAIAGVASDVYQLGLLLHLLVTGMRPFERADDDPARLLQAVRDGATLPSRLALTISADRAAARGSTPKRLERTLRGDLDSIILHTLESDPDKRYPGVRALAEDLKRWLDDQPIGIGGYSRLDRSLRYLRRHWIGVTAVATIAVLLISYALTITWQSVRLNAERNQSEQARLRAEAMHGFLLQILASADPNQSDARGKSVDDILAEGLERARSEFRDQPLLSAQLLVDLGDVLMRRGRLVESESALRDALEIRERLLGPDTFETLRILPALTYLLVQQNHLDEAHANQSRLLTGLQAIDDVDPEYLIRAHVVMAMTEVRMGGMNEAEARIVDARAAHLRLFGAGPWTQGEPLAESLQEEIDQQHAVILGRGGRFAEAEPILARVASAWEKRFGRYDQRTQTAWKNLGAAQVHLGRLAEAGVTLQSVLEVERSLYAEPNWIRGRTLGHLGAISLRMGDFDQSAAYYLAAADEEQASFGEAHPDTLESRFKAAHALYQAERHEEASTLLDRLATNEGASDDLRRRVRELRDQYQQP